MQIGDKLSRSVDISERITRVLQHRLQAATERFRERMQKAAQGMQPAAAAGSAWPQYPTAPFSHPDPTSTRRRRTYVGPWRTPCHRRTAR